MEQKGKTSTQKQNDVIDLVELAQVLWSKIHIIIVCFLVGALVAGGYTKIIVTPQYTATSMIYILGETTSITSVANLQLSSELTADFSMLAKRRKVIEKVNKDLNLGKTYEELCDVITIENPTDTHILTILATDPDAETAKDIANAMAEAVADNLSTVMATEKPSIAEEAVTPKEPSSPNTKKNIMMGALFGAVLAMGIIIVQFLLDDTIKNEDDVKKYLNINTFASFPDDKSKGKKKKKRVQE